MKNFALFACALFLAFGASESLRVGDAMSQSLELALNNLIESLEEENHEDERLYLDQPSLPTSIWSDCGRTSQSIVQIKDFRMNATCLKAPGKVMIGFNVTSAKDISGPISLNFIVWLKIGKKWRNVCSRVPGGCKRDDVCPKGQDNEPPTASEDENPGEEGVGWGADEYEHLQRKPSPAANACVQKGSFASPMRSYAIPKAPTGDYRVQAKYMKGKDQVACLLVRFRVCK